MPHLVWSDYASRDMRRHYDFLAEKDRKAAARAVKTIRQSLLGLLRAPLMGRPAEDQMQGHRELVIHFGQSSYVAKYRVNRDEITVLGIRHGREAGY